MTRKKTYCKQTAARVVIRTEIDHDAAREQRRARREREEQAIRGFVSDLCGVEPALGAAVDRLVSMLRLRRAHNTYGEELFVRRHVLDWLAQRTPYPTYKDAADNIHVTVPYPDAWNMTSYILWSAHTDDVSTATPYAERGLCLHVDGDNYYLALSPDDLAGDCLGADNAAGVFLLTEMIAAGVPGHYVFHRGEEHGCIGSSELTALLAGDNPAQRTKLPADVCARIKGAIAAIAFDRRGTSSIITHQCGYRTTSEGFAKTLAAVLAAPLPGDDGLSSGLAYVPDSTGAYTDTYQYVDLIRECTNVSVGTENEHRPTERLNVGHVLTLRQSLLSLVNRPLAFVELEDARSPTPLADKEPGYWWDDRSYRAPDWMDQTLEALCTDDPEMAAAFIECAGFDYDDLQKFARSYHGRSSYRRRR